MKDTLFVGYETRDKLIAGINRTCDAVKATLGAKGSNVLLEISEHPYTQPTNDGISIIDQIYFEDPIENMGAFLVKETSGRHNRQSGDGSTTTATLLQAILKEAISCKEAPIEIMRSLNETLPIILASVNDQTKKIDVNEVGNVASISAEDATIGSLIQEIYTIIGKDGILYPDVSKTFADHYTIGKGIKIDMAGFISPYMADLDTDGKFLKTVTWKNPNILITKQKLSAASELNDLAAYLFKNEIKELVVFASEVEGAVIPDLIRTRAERGFRIVVVKIPVLWGDWWTEDIAKITGATIIDPVAGVSLKSIKPEHLGKCGDIIISKDDTFLDGIQDISEYIKELEKAGDDDSKIRVARLNTKTARLFVGAHSDAMLSYRRLKIEDARNSAYLALQHGIVPGGGLALLNASEVMPDTVGGRILRKALKAPIRQIIANSGLAPIEIGLGGTKGFNAKTGETVDMFDAGIIDAAFVTKNSIQNALSVAATVLTVSSIVTLPRQELPNNPQGVIMR